MERIGANSSTNSAASTNGVIKKAAAVKALSSDFDTVLKANLTPSSSGQVSEEELFAALIGERITATKGAEARTEWDKVLADTKKSHTAADGFVGMEAAALSALKQLVKKETLTAEEGDQLFSEAFEAAQLDQNKNALYDSRGGAGDPTVAMAALDVALKGARGILEKFIDGSAELTVKSLTSASPNGKSGNVGSASTDTGSSVGTTSSGSTVDGPEGFLFKPVTNNEGRLAVLLGRELTGNISSVIIKDSVNKVIEEGALQTAGISETGREKYVFSKPGGKYPDNITVEIKLKNGSIQRYEIADPSKRYD